MQKGSALRIGLPTKRYLPFAETVLSGMTVVPVAGRLVFRTRIGHLILLLRAPDIPALVISGDLDIGLAPDEWTIEHQFAHGGGASLNMVPATPLGIRISMLEASGRPLGGKPAVVASPYPNITREFLRSYALDARVITVTGSAEAFVPAIADAAIDCVETGRTARIHGLSETTRLYNDLGLSLVFRDPRLEPDASEIAALVRNSKAISS